MIWPGLLFNLCVGLLLAAYLLRAVRRFERTADAVMARLDREHAERMARLDREHAEEMRKYSVACEEIRASLRAQTDRAIAEMRAMKASAAGVATAEVRVAVLGGVSFGGADPGRPAQQAASLPRWAQVAFAARCARRVLPLVEHFWSDAPQRHLSALESAVSAAERAAARAEPAPAHIGVAVRSASQAADDAGVDHAPVAIAAVGAAADAARTAGPRDSSDAAVLAANLVRSAEPFRRDIETAHGLAVASGWTDDTLVPPSVFGPLWPDGPPEGWPKPERPAGEMVFEFGIPDDLGDADLVVFVAELAAAMCSLNLAGGGRGLSIPDPEMNPFEITAPAPAPVGPPAR
ncbi:MAG: hypothetical protein C0501_07130 [Isosphaera sp.]|nr:hypothetical protein [Isosphaera sp.]